MVVIYNYACTNIKVKQTIKTISRTIRTKIKQGDQITYPGPFAAPTVNSFLSIVVL
jgi:hypothetical protein